MWGPHMWATIHTLALKADSDYEIEPYNEFLNSLLFLLPCDSCRLDFNKYYNAKGSAVVGEAFHWSVDLHNHVNQKLGKPVFTLEQARSNWNNSHCSYKCQTDKIEKSFGSLYAFAFVAVILVVVYYFYKRK